MVDSTLETPAGKTRDSDRALRVLVIVPAFNEERSLLDLIDRLTSLYPHYDVVVIDDGSADGTKEAVRQTRARVVSLACNLGIGGAVQTGFCIARDESYDIAVQVDGDGQHPPSQVHLLVDAIRQSGCDIAIGSRFLQVSGYQSTRSRRLGIWFFSAWLSAICHTRITDGTSGFRALNRRAINLLSRHYAEDYPEVEAIVVAHRAALRIDEVAVEMSARSEGVSSIGGLRAIGYMFKVSLAILMCTIRKPEIAR